jgi:2-methylcitrate dehydratase PrpD
MSGKAATKSDYGAAPLDLGITKTLASFLSRLTYDDLSDEARHQVRRGVLDWAGCALAGARHPTIAKILTVMRALNDAPRAHVIGHGLKIGTVEAATLNGQMGHLLDYDDTHMGGVVLHASSPILSALFALAQTRGHITGRDLAVAYAVGFEAGVRVGQSAPGHHDGGWHLTGTLGSIAAGAACARLLGLDEKQMVHALGIATTQAAGMQQNRGTMCKSFHAGKAAANGILAALLAEQGFDSSDEIIEGKRGFSRIYSTIAKPEQVLEELGTRFEIARNGHKPYACGVVLHPAIDAVIALRSLTSIDPAQVACLRVMVHPMAVRITGVVEPQTGLQSKFSIYHSAAVALMDGHAGISQYTNDKALDPVITALRRHVEVIAHENLRKDEARAHLRLQDGRVFDTHIPHASGTIDHPMSDQAIAAKFIANATSHLGKDKAQNFADLCWQIEKLEDATSLAEALA